MSQHNGIEVRARGVRVQREKQLPSKAAMARNAFKAAGQAIASGFKKVSEEEQARRLAICEGCEFFRQSDKRCSKCGCAMKWKSRLAGWHCPIEKW